jgi:hypothetical protein
MTVTISHRFPGQKLSKLVTATGTLAGADRRHDRGHFEQARRAEAAAQDERGGHGLRGRRLGRAELREARSGKESAMHTKCCGTMVTSFDT